MAERQWYREVLEEPDPERQLRLTARNSRVVKLRVAALMEVIRSAAPIDPDIAALWSRIQTEFHAIQRAIVESLDAKQALRPGLDVDRATDILWTLNHPDLWQLLVGERGWTPERYEQWWGDVTCAQLLEGAMGGDPCRAQGPRRSSAQPAIVSPVSSSVFRSLRIQLQPPPAASMLAGDQRRRLRRVLELVDHRQLRDAVRARLDLPREAREPLGHELRIPEAAPRLDELPRRVGLDDLAVDDHLRRAHRPHRLGCEPSVSAARTQVVLAGRLVAVPLRSTPAS